MICWPLKISLIMFCGLLAISAEAQDIDKSGMTSPPRSRQEYCSRITDSNYIKSLFYAEDNHLAFTNHGGIGDGGVCWWHSMFTRNANYLVVFRPDKPKISAYEATQIIDDITTSAGVVEIAGYHNLKEFSQDYSHEIQWALERSQIGDGGLLFGWIRGLKGSSRVAPEVLKNSMDDLYSQVKKGRIAYQMLQVPGITSHAWLVVDMIKTTGGYDLEVLDSNYLNIRTIQYRYGMTQLNEYRSVPYTGRNTFAYWSYSTAKINYCRYGWTAKDLRERRQN